jgi:hypothetical protein
VADELARLAPERIVVLGQENSVSFGVELVLRQYLSN